MDYSAIITGISSVGFPIIACVMVYRAMLENNKDFNSQVREMMQMHSAEIKSLQKSLDDNTTVIARLIDRIDDLEENRKRERIQEDQ